MPRESCSFSFVRVKLHVTAAAGHRNISQTAIDEFSRACSVYSAWRTVPSDLRDSIREHGRSARNQIHQTVPRNCYGVFSLERRRVPWNGNRPKDVFPIAWGLFSHRVQEHDVLGHHHYRTREARRQTLHSGSSRHGVRCAIPASGMTQADILREFPCLTEQDIRAPPSRFLLYFRTQIALFLP